MSTTVAILILFLTCCAVNVFYWHVVHQTAIRSIRFRLFARRDKLRRLALDKKEDHTSFAYKELEGFICKTIAAVPSISLLSLLLFSFRYPRIKSEEMERFRSEASPQLVGLLQKTVKDALYMMMLNSPILVTVGGIVALLLWLAGRFNKMLVYRQAENFVDELPSEYDEPVLQPA